MAEEIHLLDEEGFTYWLEKSKNPNLDISTLVDLADSIIDRQIPIHASYHLDLIDINSKLKFYDLYSLNFTEHDVQEGISRDAAQRLITLVSKLDRVTVSNPPSVEIKDLTNNLISSIPNWHAAGMLEVIPKTDIYTFITVDAAISEDKYKIVFNGFEQNIFILKQLDSLQKYFRAAILCCQYPENTFFFHWDNAFPNLLKSDTLTFRRFQGDCASVLSDVVDHLSFLNDEYLNLCSECNNDFPTVMSIAKAKFGISLSNESSNTRNSKSKMRQREATFSGKTAECECHTKLSPTINRIHFHAPEPSIHATKLLIGIFVDHLET